MNTDVQTKNETPSSSIWAGGLLAISLIIFQCFLSPDIKVLDNPSLVSIFALALAIPMLAYKIFINTLRERKHSTKVQSSIRQKPFSRSERFFFVTGAFFALVGTAAAFYHIHLIAAAIFSACTIIIFLTYLINSLRI